MNELDVNEVASALEDFLIDRELLDSFLQESCLETVENLYNYVKLKSREPGGYLRLIDAAFTWSRTEKGKNFWYAVDDGWDTALERLKFQQSTKYNSIW